ncbi:hypothetical protein AUR64_19260 [Haloprofundus marisrubri]|uniref:Uncharacterized protein n=1 Tax=Haloprofundus marisrubri TaxID=1514971 RepID=A0A0W1R500_9EURY|nr:hypothetical protein [Haloprofundus marisrubri]KTG08372.1 hypothetical protein AUR64_19260 [Haloprofundus marisrubri]
MSDATERLLAAIKQFGGESLRDVWLFDQWTHEQLYLRSDAAADLSALDVDALVDNERYGYVTRDTYESLFADSYAYTVRGFEHSEQFRTFLADCNHRVGVLAGFDRPDAGHDFAQLHEDIAAAVSETPVEEFMPSTCD